MIDNLFELFKKFIEVPDDEPQDDNAMVLAAVSLMLEVARSDAGGEQVEHAVIRNILTSEFNVEGGLVDNLLEAGVERVEGAIDLFQFTQLINEHYSHDQKEGLIYAMWRVALADGKVQAIEDHIIRRVAGLIYVAHSDFIRLKLKARG
ncbi:MAG: TerB family tellurite resistance protein [Gammaproteobacteria bacterium]|nr:TerB family tellurite resistance protein [Gammaproteobacteria bacterium]MBT6890840.1 TerB family tellurite resistance protein [Gammaproteobacteria bacterium]